MTLSDPRQWAELAALFDEISELEPAKRDERLQALRARDAELAKRLDALLAADAEASGPLERSLDEVAPRLHETLLDGAWETRAGLVLGRYRLIEPIGSGGMGEVWRAERADGEYRQDVAVKLLKRGMDTQAILYRFLQERSILARLQHPGIVRLLDGGMGEDGRPYYVMEHVRGDIVTAYAKQAQLDVRARVGLVAAIADAVGYAHAQLVVHRDIKPSNVIVDADGAPHLLDFGIAKLLEASGEQTMTGAGMRALSPAYAAPEQILGEAVGTAVDVYALGVLLHELLTGRLPHRRASRDPDRLAAELARETSETPSHALARREDLAADYGHTDRKRLAREVSGDLDLIVTTATRREPERRYATVAAFADDLRRWLARRPITARADNTGYRVGRFIRRHRIGVGAAALVVVALLSGLGAALWQADLARKAATRADSERDLAHQQARRAERVKDFVLALFREQDPASRARAAARTPPELIRDGILQVDASLAGDPALQGELLRDLGEIQASLGEAAAGSATLKRAWQQLSSVAGADSVAAIEAEVAYAGSLVHTATNGDGEKLLREATRKLAAALGPDHVQVAKAEGTLARIAMVAGRNDEALELARHAGSVAEATYGKGHLETVPAIYMVGVVEGVLSRYDDALKTLGEGLAIIERDLGADHVRTITFHSQIGDLLRYQRRFDESIVHVAKALAIARAQLPSRHPMIGGMLFRLADTHRRMGKFDEAEAAFAEGATILAESPGPHHAQLMQAYSVLASAKGQHRLAIDRLRIAVEGFRNTTGDSAHTLLTELALVDALATAGQLVDADRLGASVVRKIAETMAADSYEVGYSNAVTGRLRFLQGRHAEAIPIQRQTLAFLLGLYDERHLDVAEARLLLARTLLARGDKADLAEIGELVDRAQPVVVAAATKPVLVAEAHLLRAELALRAGDRAGARSAIDEAGLAASRDRTDAVALQRRVDALRRRIGGS